MRDIEPKLRDDLRSAREALAEAERAAERARWQIDYITGLLAEGGGLFEASEKPSNGHAPQNSATTPGQYTDWPPHMVLAHVLGDAPHGLRVVEIAERALAGGWGAGDPDMDTRKAHKYFSSVLSRALGKPDAPVALRKVGRGRFSLMSRPSPE